MNNQTSYNELAIQAASGDSQAMAELYDAFNNEIFRFVFLRVGKHELAEDVTSTIFLKVVKHIKKYNPNKASFRTWLYTIARHTVIDTYRNQKDTFSLDNIPKEPIAKTSLIARAEVEQILSTLSDEQREIVTLRVIQGLPFSEVCVIVGKSEAATKTFFYRTMQQLSKTHSNPLMLLLTLSYVL